MAEWIKVIILGIVEGVTEFLPISSTGHLLVASALLNFEGSLGGTFEIFIQIGAVLAVIAFYRADLLRQVLTVRSDKGIQRLWLSIVIAALPAAVVGFLLEDWLEDNVFTRETAPTVVAIALIVGGIIFLLVERRPARTESVTHDLTQITPRQALLIGLAQITALIPGVSRSGSTIIGGLMVGLDRSVATAFSFYLSIPVLGGATFFKLITSLDEINSNDVFNLALGTVVSAIVAWISIGWLLRYVARNNFIPFGYYRILAGVAILLLVISGVL
ncbi:MAG: undecaprenyl-diphosphate phosphatase [bacterium]|nr:undecaprenyl-diphosphate phosphatase [bacterium]